MDAPRRVNVCLPFNSLSDLNSEQKKCIDEIIEILRLKTLVPTDVFKTTSLSELKENNEINRFLKRMLSIARESIPYLSAMKKGSDFLLKKEIDQYVQQLEEGMEKLGVLQNSLDEFLNNFDTTVPCPSAYKPHLDQVGNGYGQCYCHLVALDARYQKLSTKIQQRIDLYGEKTISPESLELVVNVFDFDLHYLQNNIGDFKNNTESLKLKYIEIARKKSDFEKLQKHFDQSFNLLSYRIENGSSTLNMVYFYAYGKCNALEKYLSQNPNACTPDEKPENTPCQINPDENTIIEVLTTLAKKCLVIEGGSASLFPCNHLALSLVCLWTPCFNDEKQKKDGELDQQVKKLSESIDTVFNDFQRLNLTLDECIYHPPQDRQDVGLAGDGEYLAKSPKIEAIGLEFSRLKGKLEERIGFQKKTGISKAALKIISRSHDNISPNNLQEKMTAYFNNTRFFKESLEKLNYKLDAMNQEIRKYQISSKNYAAFYENNLAYNPINQLLVWGNFYIEQEQKALTNTSAR